MSDKVISQANLTAIEGNLISLSNKISQVQSNVEVIHSEVQKTSNNVRIVQSDIEKLKDEFREYIKKADMQHNLSIAETRLVKIRQELERKFGYYSEVRRTTTGILQADDLGIVQKETITNVTEELMITTPNYWLTPCLVALAAWINDQPELADKAVREGIRRNDEKTSLLFALICRRADRKSASMKWIQRYLANQDERNLDRKAIIILDAYANGLLGVDSEMLIFQLISQWIENLSTEAGFIEEQIKQWSNAFNLKRQILNESGYTYLQKYSHTWPVLSDIMEGAHLHGIIYSYFDDIFNKQTASNSLKEQLDGILDSLVNDFDDEELPLRQNEKLNQFILDFNGDLQRANDSMKIEKSAFENKKNFTQLLTDAAMKPESANASVSTQKFSIALSKNWISNAYNDVTAKNRSKVPHEIEINIDTFNDTTIDGKDEEALVSKFNNLIDKEKADAISKCFLTGFEKFCLFGGSAIGILGILMLISGNVFFGGIAVVAGIGMVINHFSHKKSVESMKRRLDSEFEQKRENGLIILRAILAEVVDFREEFTKKDIESKKVNDFLEQISPEQYIRKINEASRKIKLA